MKKIVFNIANEFTEMPLLPYKDDGDFSAEELLEKHLIPLYNKAKAEGKILIIELDGAIGYSPTFLRVAFEGLAEQGDDVTDIVKIVSDFMDINEKDISYNRVYDLVENNLNNINRLLNAFRNN